MNLPHIDVSALPGLAVSTGIFGSNARQGTLTVDDSTVAVMTFLYDHTHR